MRNWAALLLCAAVLTGMIQPAAARERERGRDDSGSQNQPAQKKDARQKEAQQKDSRSDAADSRRDARERQREQRDEVQREQERRRANLHGGADEAARIAQRMNGGGRVLNVTPDGDGYRVRLLKNGEVRSYLITVD